MKYLVALWGPTVEHPHGIVWGAPAEDFDREIKAKTEKWGSPLRVTEMDVSDPII